MVREVARPIRSLQDTGETGSTHAPDSNLEDPKVDPHWEWVKDPDVCEAVRPPIAEEARVARFLAREGLVLNNEAYALFVDAVGHNLYPAFELLARRAAGNYATFATTEFIAIARFPNIWRRG
jgi:hypothetical protein